MRNWGGPVLWCGTDVPGDDVLFSALCNIRSNMAGFFAKENRFRPAIDPLFRGAAVAYGPRIIGMILSGGLDDGTAGLYTIKAYGGITVVQDPQDAEVPSMPANALRHVRVDHRVPLAEMPGLLVRLCRQEAPEKKEVGEKDDERNRREVGIALQDRPATDIGNQGTLTTLTRPVRKSLRQNSLNPLQMQY